MNQLPPSIAQNAYRKTTLGMAQQVADAQQAGAPSYWLEPQPREKLDKTIERHIKRMGELAEDTWDDLYAMETEKESGEEFYQVFSQHDMAGDLIVKDPFTGEDMIDPATGEVVLGAFALQLRDICARQLGKDLRRYAAMKREREKQEDIFLAA